MSIPLGTIVKDKVTGLVGVAENRAEYLYGIDRYFVQPRIGDDGKVPDGTMIDVAQLEIVEGTDRVMDAIAPPSPKFKMGQIVNDPIRDMTGTVTGRAVYLNGCARVFIEPKQQGDTHVTAWWVDEEQVTAKTSFMGKEKTADVPPKPLERTGGPARSSSKY